ncbi:MAG: anaerobic ribonucleoside-triphosphate reductase [Planctomycetota bacterium]|nr:anaerobic ribonucleoside-triphosphate reductase [Planctomycetota bacterium]
MMDKIKKRDGTVVPYDERKIADAIFKAAVAVGGENRALAEELASAVTLMLSKRFSGEALPTVEDVQDTIEKVLIQTGHATTAKAYILYREKRARMREKLKVRKVQAAEGTTTDISLLVSPVTRDELHPWNKQRIVEQLVTEGELQASIAQSIADEVEERIFASGMQTISTGLVRELVDNELLERGLQKPLLKQRLIGIPKYDLEMLVYSKSKENSNIARNNPEAINLAISEHILKQYALQSVFSADIAQAHLAGKIHLHDLGYPTRVYCSSHSLEYIKKFGLKLANLSTTSGPAKYARTLTGHLNTFLASMQAYYAGALGVGYLNIFYAPYLEGMDYKEMKQEAQYLIFSGSQNAFSRGGQTLFLDFNLHTGIPDYLRDVPAIGPGGKYNGRTYAEYDKTAKMFLKAMLDVWREGDEFGHPFAFPKCDLHINADTFNDPEQDELLRYACVVASENGSPYFVFDRDAVTLAACCRLRTTIEDTYVIKHPESMRFCGFQNVTINLPQAAYRAGGSVDRFFEELEAMLQLVVKAHIEKRKFVKYLMASEDMPLWEIGKIALDGRPYVDLGRATYIVGIIGLNEAVQRLCGQQLHETEEAYKLGLKVVSFLYLRCKELSKEHNMKFSLEESPAESATRRLAKVDLMQFPEAAEFVRGDLEGDRVYYTNSVHLRADAPVDMVTRIVKQAKFHPMIESGAIIHAFVGEQKPSPDSIYNLVKKTFYNTQAAQLTISPEFTICQTCHRQERGLKDRCPHCNSVDVYGITRIVGYYSRVNNWNPSKKAELSDRQRGNYTIV